MTIHEVKPVPPRSRLRRWFEAILNYDGAPPPGPPPPRAPDPTPKIQLEAACWRLVKDRWDAWLDSLSASARARGADEATIEKARVAYSAETYLMQFIAGELIPSQAAVIANDFRVLALPPAPPVGDRYPGPQPFDPTEGALAVFVDVAPPEDPPMSRARLKEAVSEIRSSARKFDRAVRGAIGRKSKVRRR